MDNSLIDTLVEGELLYDVRTGNVVEIMSPVSAHARWLLVKMLDAESTTTIDDTGLVNWERMDVEKMLDANPVLKAIVKLIMWRLEKTEGMLTEILSLLPL